jgi:AraC family transcriptional regulator
VNAYYLERIQCGVDYIETRLDEEIELSSVAKAAGISQWHFQRIFRSLTGETLKTYIRARRLANSLDRLLKTDMRVLDIALLAGFESQEAFARAFKQAFQLTPVEYRRLGKDSLFLKKPQFDGEYLRHLHQGVSLEPELYVQRPMTLVGLRTLFFGVDSEKNNVASQLPALWQAFVARMSEVENRVPDCAYGVVRATESDSERLEYHAAVEVPRLGSVPQGMVALEVPESTYARFAHRGAVANVDHTVSYAYASWLPQSGRRHSYAADLEFYGAQYHPTRDDSVIYYAIPLV